MDQEDRMDLMETHLVEVVNPTWNKWGRAKSTRDELLNAVLGLTGEAGEVADLFKKGFFHKELDDAGQRIWLKDLTLEVGDVLYYTLKLMDLFNLDLEEVLEANREKLSGRHGGIVDGEGTTVAEHE